MKIGIVTLPFHINYGGILQAYALSKVLQKEGHKVMFIKEDKGLADRLKSIVGLQIRRTLCKIRRQPINIFDDTKKHKDITRFLRTKLPQNIEPKSEIINSLDAVIVGSDQVWRKWSPQWNIAHYFLDFVNNDRIRKISYAASLGTDEWSLNDDETRLTSSLIKDFDGVSVRESDAISICRDYLNVTPEVVLDPTMLLTRQDYSAIGANEIKGDNVVSFILDNNDLKLKVLEKIGAAFNNEVVDIGPEMQKGLKEGNELLGIEEWIKIFSEAQFIVTDSFHGSAFAINFNIPFLVLSNSKRGQSRLVSLLGTFNITDRLITDVKQVEKIITQAIDWESVNKELNRLRDYSNDFLKRSLAK